MRRTQPRQPANPRTSRTAAGQEDDAQRRADRALALAHLGELEAAPLAPATKITVAAFGDAAKRPQTRQVPLPDWLPDFQPQSGSAPFDLNTTATYNCHEHLSKPSGGIRALVMADVFRPYQYALSTRAGAEALARAQPVDRAHVRVLLLRRLRQPLPVAPRTCRCAGALDPLNHRAACPAAGVLGARGAPRISSGPRVPRGWRTRGL